MFSALAAVPLDSRLRGNDVTLNAVGMKENAGTKLRLSVPSSIQTLQQPRLTLNGLANQQVVSNFGVSVRCRDGNSATQTKQTAVLRIANSLASKRRTGMVLSLPGLC